MPSVLFNGEPGTRWRNNGQKVRYQFFCNWAYTCGLCAQYDHAIGAIWPIPLHHGCRCYQQPVLMGAEADPFIDFRAKIASLDPANQARVIGRSAWRLVEKGVVGWDDFVTPARVRSLQEVVSRLKLTVDQMAGAGVRRSIAERAFAAVNTPAEAILKAQRVELVSKLELAGLNRSQIIDLAAQKVAERVGIQGPSGSARITFNAGNLGTLLQQIAAQRAALDVPAGIAAKSIVAPKAAAPPPTKPYTIEVIGDIPTERVAEFEKWVSQLPPEVHATIRRDGGKFVYTHRLEEMDAKLAADRPIGWPADSSWKNVDGLYDDQKKHIVVAHEHLDYFTKEYRVSDRIKGVLYHEAGHGLDAALKGSSTAPRFTEAYAADVGEMTEATKRKLSYFTQSASGAKEAFAEVFANVMGEDTRHGDKIAEHFPRFTSTMRVLLEKLKVREAK